MQNIQNTNDNEEIRRAGMRRRKTAFQFCEAFAQLASSKREKVLRRLVRPLPPRGAEPASEAWSLREMLATFEDLNQISPHVARAWRSWTLEQMKLEISRSTASEMHEWLADTAKFHLELKRLGIRMIWPE